MDEIEPIDIDIKPGFYRDRCGEWMRDARDLADRRTDPFENRKYNERRTLVRRQCDRDMLEFLREAG